MHSPEASKKPAPGIKPPKSSRSLKTAVSLALVLARAGAFFYLLDPAGLFRTKQFAGPREALTLGLAHESLAALAMIARDRGYFSEAGLDVTGKGYKRGGPAVKGLLAGDVGMTPAARH